MTRGRLIVLSVPGSIIVPFLMATIIMIGSAELIGNGYGTTQQILRAFASLALLFCIGVGFYILTRAFSGFKVRLALAVFYWPIALIAQFFWALMLAGGLYGFSL